MATQRRKPAGRVGAPPKPAAAPTSEPAKTASPAGVAPTLNAGFQATTSHVQQMHQTIAGQTFDHLLRVPGLSVPTRIVQGVHDALTQGVFAAVRHGGGAAFMLAGGAPREGGAGPGGAPQGLRSAVGDSFAAAGHALSVQMGLHEGGAPLAPTPAALAHLQPRVCVFLHGLACDEMSWTLRSDAWRASPWADALPGRALDYGALLAHELGVSAIYLRYHTGLAIDANARQFAALLEQAAQSTPQVREWVLIGHSMGGLVAQRAREIAVAEGMGWPARAPMIVCLGSPHGGAALDRLPDRAGAGRSSQVSKGRAKAKPASVAPPALRLVFGTLGDERGAMSPLIGQVLGDGLVMPGGASTGSGGADVQRVELAGLGHMTLLNHPRVYAELRRWLGAPALG